MEVGVLLGFMALYGRFCFISFHICSDQNYERTMMIWHDTTISVDKMKCCAPINSKFWFLFSLFLHHYTFYSTIKLSNLGGPLLGRRNHRGSSFYRSQIVWIYQRSEKIDLFRESSPVRILVRWVLAEAVIFIYVV